jgi:hypothetical protein
MSTEYTALSCIVKLTSPLSRLPLHYGCDLGGYWQHQIRIEALLTPIPPWDYPVCIGANAPARRKTVGVRGFSGYQAHPTRTFSPLTAPLAERMTPELLYLEANSTSPMSYGLTTKPLGELLPMGHEVEAATVRNHLYKVAQRCEDELGGARPMFAEGCERGWEDLPRPDLPLTVGIDRGYVHASGKKAHHESWFEVIVGKSMPAERTSKCAGFVQRNGPKPTRRLF